MTADSLATPAVGTPASREGRVRASTPHIRTRTGCDRREVTARDAGAFTAVLAAARTGSEWAWTVLYRGLAPTVLGYLLARGAAEPEDLAGEVFLQAVRDLRRFEGDERAFRAWLLTIAHHRLLDARRHRARRPVEVAPEDVIDSRSPTGDVEEDALRRLDLAGVRMLIGGLSPDQRSVLLLRIVGDLTVEEIARVVGKRPGAVKALQRRGLAALERELARRNPLRSSDASRGE
jgi:RNA polymerase sigma-70 factor (ECF subfamily)